MDSYGPTLPPGFSNPREDIGPTLPGDHKGMDDARRERVSEEEEDVDIGPALPPHLRQKPSKTEPRSSSKVESKDDVIGPALPPHLQQRMVTSHESDDDDDDDEGCPELNVGPSLPPRLLKKQKKAANRSPDSLEQTFGAQLPPDYSRWNTFDVNASDDAFSDDDDDDDKKQRKGDKSDDREEKEEEEEDDDDDDAYGPALPPGFKQAAAASSSSSNDAKTSPPPKIRGPSLQPGFLDNSAPIAYPVDALNSESSDDDGMIGPMPLAPGSEALYATSAAEEFEKRSRAMKEKLIEKDQPEKKNRDSWMTELPGYSTNFGLGPRSFRKTARPEAGDRSGWTDTPADRERKEKERAEKKRSEARAAKSRAPEEKVLSERDKRLSALVSKHNETKRGESLVDMHSKDRKRKLEEEGDKPKERRPFDRDLDLKANQFDDAKRKLLIKKSAQLNEKFSHSKEKMFL